MPAPHALRLAAVAALGASALTFAGPAGTAQARVAEGDPTCLASASGSAARGLGHHGPDHREMSASERAAIERRTADLLQTKGHGKRNVVDDDTFGGPGDVPVYVHVMQGKYGEGDVDDQQIRDQVAALNSAYGEGGYTFTLQGIDRYRDKHWHVDKRSQSENYRSRTRQGGADALNIWLVDYQQQLLGVATFPWDYAADPDIDGVRVDYRSLPGGAFANYDEGDTVVHEAGHWLGLFHTFEGGCSEPGDYVSDTTPHSAPTFGCPPDDGQPVPDSCEGGDADPIHNFMNYSYDACLDHFTSGQFARMEQIVLAYRT